MKIIITGPKASGKTTLGTRLSQLLSIEFYETDVQLEEIYCREKGERLPFREIFRKLGEDEFREYEKKAVKELAARDWCIVSSPAGKLF